MDFSGIEGSVGAAMQHSTEGEGAENITWFGILLASALILLNGEFCACGIEI